MARRRRRSKKNSDFFADFKKTFQLKPKTRKTLSKVAFWGSAAVFSYIIYNAYISNVQLTPPSSHKNAGTAAAPVKAPASKPAPKPVVRTQTPAVREVPQRTYTPERVTKAASVTPVVHQNLPPLSSTGFKPKIAFVIDDMGHTGQFIPLITQLGNKVTYAILPHLAHTEFFGKLSRQTNADVILHLPLESSVGTIPGPGLITDRMPEDQIRDVLRRNLSSIPNHIGVNNHMGSEGTANPQLMRVILSELKRQNLLFLDSYTTPKTTGIGIARELGIPSTKRDVFLDNVDSQEAVRTQVNLTRRIARKQGSAVAIGHYRYNTLTVLNEEIPKLIAEGYEVIALSQMIALRSRSR